MNSFTEFYLGRARFGNIYPVHNQIYSLCFLLRSDVISSQQPVAFSFHSASPPFCLFYLVSPYPFLIPTDRLVVNVPLIERDRSNIRLRNQHGSSASISASGADVRSPLIAHSFCPAVCLFINRTDEGSSPGVISPFQLPLSHPSK